MRSAIDPGPTGGQIRDVQVNLRGGIGMPPLHDHVSLEEAKQLRAQNKCFILLFRNSAVSPIARAARRVLLFRTAGPSFFSTMVGALALAEVLVARLAASGGRAVIGRLERTDDALREAGAYWDASWTRFPALGRV